VNVPKLVAPVTSVSVPPVSAPTPAESTTTALSVTKPLWVIDVALVVKLTIVGPEVVLPLLLPLLDELEPLELEPLPELDPEELDPLELELLDAAPLELPELLFEPLPLLLELLLPAPLLLLELTLPLLELPLWPDSHAVAAAAATSAQFVQPPHGNDCPAASYVMLPQAPFAPAVVHVWSTFPPPHWAGAHVVVPFAPPPPSPPAARFVPFAPLQFASTSGRPAASSVTESRQRRASHIGKDLD